MDKPLKSWFDRNLAEYIGEKPEIGDLDIKWHTVECQAEQDGEIVEIWRWDGDGWEDFSLHCFNTVGDLQDLDFSYEDDGEKDLEWMQIRADEYRDSMREDGIWVD